MTPVRKVLGWPKICKLADAFLWEHSYKRLKLAQLGVFIARPCLQSPVEHRHAELELLARRLLHVRLAATQRGDTIILDLRRPCIDRDPRQKCHSKSHWRSVGGGMASLSRGGRCRERGHGGLGRAVWPWRAKVKTGRRVSIVKARHTQQQASVRHVRRQMSTTRKQNWLLTQKCRWPKFRFGIIITLSIFSFRA